MAIFIAVRIEALDLQAADRVYHLGCGVGYYTAIIAGFCKLIEQGAGAARASSPEGIRHNTH